MKTMRFRMGMAWMLGTIGAANGMAGSTNELERAAPTNGLVFHFSFDAVDGPTVISRAGPELEGRIHRAAWTANGAFGGALRFDGNSRVDLGPGRFRENQSFTIAAWVNASELDSHMRIFDSANSGDGWDLGLDGTGSRFEL